ncbi:hypothetical protein [Chlamydiifrater volucris]|uniref:hypothetical protein n=1 Tax=Chlamydiifrater volucris TaxID=2681470 RepID=UPI001BD011F0|nr:hypothetical protein [Chlamydiifrater volucris]
MRKNSFKRITRGVSFSNQFKRLKKKFRSLEEDLETFITAQLFAYHKEHKDNGGICRIPFRKSMPRKGVGCFKARRFSCKSLKGKGSKTDIRITYAYISLRDEIYFVEIYLKADKANEDRSLFDAVWKYMEETSLDLVQSGSDSRPS